MRAIYTKGVGIFLPFSRSYLCAGTIHFEKKLLKSCNYGNIKVSLRSTTGMKFSLAMSKLSGKELEICHRLRAFREGTKISRARFAVAISIGSERLASYEAGRAPVRYETFSAISQKFFLNPIWLATGDTAPLLHGPFDDSQFLGAIRPRALFSEVYDSVLKESLDEQKMQATAIAKNSIAQIHQFAQLPEKVLKRVPKDKVEEILKAIDEVRSILLGMTQFEDLMQKQSAPRKKR